MNAVMLFPYAKEVFGDAATEEARRDSAIRHFEGPGENKPWHYLYSGELRNLYFDHRRRTPWPRVHREGMTPRNVLRRLRLSARRTGHSLEDR